MNKQGEEFLRYIVKGVWSNLIVGQGHYLYYGLRDSIYEIAMGYRPRFQGDFELVLDSLTNRIKAEFEPLLMRHRILLDADRTSIDFEGLISDIYKENPEYWDGAF